MTPQQPAPRKPIPLELSWGTCMKIALANLLVFGGAGAVIAFFMAALSG